MKLISISIFAAAALMASCDKSDDATNVIESQPARVVSDMRGYKAIPTNSSPATGIFRADLDPGSGILIYSLAHTELTQTPGTLHIHEGSEGKVGPVVFDLGTVALAPIAGSLQLSKEQVTNMLSGKYYVDIHNNSFLEGEIRGQIVKGSPVE